MSGRQAAVDVLRRVFTQGSFAASALRAAFDGAPDLSALERALATELVYGVLRRRSFLDRALKQAAGRPLKDMDPRLHDPLRLGAYQLMYLDRVPSHAAVDTTVELAKARGGKKAAGTVNAILRKLAALTPDQRLPAPPSLATDPVRAVAERAGLPHKLAALLVEDMGAETALAFGEASLLAAPLTLRANRLRTTRDALVSEAGGSAGHLPWSVRLPEKLGGLPAELDAVRAGRATPQDEASMRVVALLDPQPGERVLDVCSAPGGKTTHAAEAMGDQGEVVAHDRLPDRLRRVEESARRLGLLSVRTVDILPTEAEAPFDRVLVDAPCSGLGTLRRHPEIRWRFSLDELPSLLPIQALVLREGARRVRPGGTLVYSVCTVTKAEGEAQLAPLATDFEVQEILRTGPQQEGAPDGFFAAKLRRRES